MTQPTVEQLLEALRPFANAYARLRHYGGVSDDDTLYADHGNSLFELFADENEAHGKDPQQLLAVGHLANAAQFFQD